MWMVMWMLLLGFGAGGGKDIKFEHFTTEPGIYFEELGRATLSTSDWIFVAFYNLSSYWHEWSQLQRTTQQLRELCGEKNHELFWIQNCVPLLQPVGFLMANLEDHNRVLMTSTTRNRRAPFEFMGTLFNDLFGVLDQRDAKRYHDQLTEVAAGTLQLQQLVQKQTQVLDVTANLLRKEKKLIEEHYNILRNDIRGIEKHEDFIDTLLQLSLTLSLFKDTQNALIDVLSDVHHGRINTKLISPRQLEEHLQRLPQQLPSNTRLPTFKLHWAQIYKLLNTKAAIVGEQVIFEIRLPLLRLDEFQVFNVIPVPTRHDNRFLFIEPEFPYILVNTQRSWYYPITSEALKACQRWEENSMICTQDQPIYHMQTKDVHCEVALLRHEATPSPQCHIKAMLPVVYIKKFQQDNRWILVLDTESIFDLNCNNTIRPVSLQGSGILTLHPGCTLRGRFVTITSHSSYKTTEKVSLLPNFNLSMEVRAKDIVISSGNFDADISSLQQTIDDLRQEETGKFDFTHHIGHYTSTGTLLIIGMILIIVVHRRRNSGRNSYRPQLPLNQPSQPIPMPRRRTQRISI